jgi:predicted negative regulator of RcsB-dependent stress response
MADKKNQEPEKDPEAAIASAIGRTEDWILQNGKTLLTILGVLVIVVGGYFGYRYLYQAPRQEKAAAAMFRAQNAFDGNLFELALNGDANTAGFLSVIDQYGSTASGNLARHYAGQCYLRLGQYDEAIRYFDQYKTVRGSIPARLVNAMNAGLTGDACVQKGDLARGASQYEKAVEAGADELTTPYYCRKAGQLYEQLGDYPRALAMYRRIKVHYPASLEAQDVDKYIARVEQKI